MPETPRPPERQQALHGCLGNNWGNAKVLDRGFDSRARGR